MNSNLNDILQYKTSKENIDKTKLIDILNKEISKFDFEEDYLTEGCPRIENATEVTFYTCILENFIDTRVISGANRPNRLGVPMGHKKISEFNIWDYNLNYEKEFCNSYDSYEIPESYHAIGCPRCNQYGKIRCSSCRGAGDITCHSCSGRGEKQCTNCNGRVDIKCWSCSGKGTKEIGYGENKKTERCSSCSGRGSNKCTSCSNGFVTCSTCSRRGRVTCYTCEGSGEVTCYTCEGYKTMNHYYTVTASFVNLSQNLLLTNSYPGFDKNKSQLNNFNIQNKIFDLCENRFKESYFEKIKTSPFYSQIKSFFDFPNSDSSKLIKSRITFFENKYTEITFSFYGVKYILYLDKNLENSYYDGRKPSDQYELDLLKKALHSSVKNELDLTKKTIEKLAEYEFISIDEKTLISAIEDTQKIYKAKDKIDNKNYSYAESILKSVSKKKKSEADYERLIKHLNRLYFINTLIIGAIFFFGIIYKLLNKENQFILWNILISIGILSLCLILNRIIRSLHWARWIVSILFSIQFVVILYFEKIENERNEYLDLYMKELDSIANINNLKDTINSNESISDTITQNSNIKVLENEDMVSFINNYYSDLNNGTFDANKYYNENVDQFISLKDTSPSEINNSYNLNNDFKNGTSTFDQNSLKYEGSDGELSYYTYWVNYSCYRPSKNKYQNCDVKIELVIDFNLSIHSYREIKVSNLKFFDNPQ